LKPNQFIFSLYNVIYFFCNYETRFSGKKTLYNI